MLVSAKKQAGSATHGEAQAQRHKQSMKQEEEREMRTLAELHKLAENAKQAFATREAECKEEAEKAAELYENAKNEADAAVQAGNSEAYSEAEKRMSFLQKVVENKQKEKARPYFEPDQHNAIIEELREALKEENAPLYNHLADLIDEWEATAAKITENCKIANETDSLLVLARDPDDRAFNSAWNRLGGAIVAPLCVRTLFEHGEIRRYRHKH